MMKPSFFAFFCTMTLCLYAGEEQSLSLEQKLKLKLIEEHWKDRDFFLAKTQIEEYLKQFPEHFATSHLHLMVGDLYFEEKNYQEALKHYKQVNDPKLKNTAADHRLYCKLMLKDYQGLKEDAQTLSSLSSSAKRILAEGFFQEARISQDINYRSALLSKAKNYYLELLGTPHEDSLLAPLADIYRYEKNYSAAAETYLKLASKYNEEKKEHYLFQAAQMYSLCDKEKAYPLFENLRNQGGEYALQALVKELQLLSQYKEYLKILQITSDELAIGTNPSSTALLYYYKGKASLCEGRLEDAINAFNSALEEKLLTSEIQKKAYLSLLYCAKEQKNISLADHSIEELKEHFPKDPDVASALLVHLSMNVELSRNEKAKEDLESLLKIEENQDKKYRYELDLAIIESKLSHHEAACVVFQKFIEDPYTAPYAKEALKHFIKSVSSLIEENDTLKTKKDSFSSLLKAFAFINTRPDLIDPRDQEKFSFLYAKVLFENNQKKAALEKIYSLLNGKCSQKVEHLSHLLAARAAEDLLLGEDKIAYHLLRAIALEDDLSSKASLHIKLFNVMLPTNEKQAADHLFSAFTLEPSRIQNNNLLWLAHYFFKKANEHPLNISLKQSPEALIFAQRSIRLFSYAFETPGNLMGEHLYTCSRLLFTIERYEESKKLLELALKQPLTSASQRAEFNLFLAKIETIFGNEANALNEIEKLLKAFPPTTTKIGQKAYLEKHKILKKELLKRPLIQEEDKDFLSLISSFKMLEITRLDAFEPIGIEASMDIIDLKLCLIAEDKKPQEAIKLYSSLKDRYELIRNSLIQKDTSQSIKSAELISIYLNLIENEIKRFTGSGKADTYGNQKTPINLPSIIERSDPDADYIRQRLYSAF